MLLQASRARNFWRLCIRHFRWLLLARSTRSNKTCLRAPPRSPPPLITRIPSPLALHPHLFAATFKANSAKPRAPSMAAARHARARRSTCPSSRSKSKRLTRNLCWRRNAWTGKNGVRVFDCPLFILHSLRQAERRIRAAQWQHQSQQAGTQVDARRNSATSNL
jgi:hypothetical protein